MDCGTGEKSPVMPLTTASSAEIFSASAGLDADTEEPRKLCCRSEALLHGFDRLESQMRDVILELSTV